jgi:putative drug exporter of the RND superfamily
VLVEHGGNAQAIAAKLNKVQGVVGAAAPAGWHRGSDSIVEAFPAVDGAAPGVQGIVDRVDQTLKGTNGTLGGVAAADRDFVHAVYGNFPYVLAFVIILTLILLARAFRSIVLPIKAALLNLVSLGAAFGIVVFIFQEGHGSSLWNISGTGAITAWIPLMIFAFLFGLPRIHSCIVVGPGRSQPFCAPTSAPEPEPARMSGSSWNFDGDPRVDAQTVAGSATS